MKSAPFSFYMAITTIIIIKNERLLSLLERHYYMSESASCTDMFQLMF